MDVGACALSSKFRGDMVKDTTNLSASYGNNAEQVWALSVSVNVVRCGVSATVNRDCTTGSLRVVHVHPSHKDRLLLACFFMEQLSTVPYVYARSSSMTNFISSFRADTSFQSSTSERAVDLLVEFRICQPPVKFVDVWSSLHRIDLTSVEDWLS